MEHAAGQVEGVSSVRSVQVRREGHRLRGEIGIAASPNLMVDAAHRLAHRVEHELQYAVNHLESANVHVEPDIENPDLRTHSPSTHQLSSLILSTHGLTPAQSRVAELVLQGRSTRQIVAELQISQHTVQEHLGVAFEKFGIGSRRELVAKLLGGPR